MDGRKVRPFTDFLREQGSVHEDLDQTETMVWAGSPDAR